MDDKKKYLAVKSLTDAGFNNVQLTLGTKERAIRLLYEHQVIWIRPGLYKLYDFTKGGTDVIDQRMGFYTTKTKSRRWKITTLSYIRYRYILDMARVNASTVYVKNKRER